MPWHYEEVNSPGMGTTLPGLSMDPLASEGEATPGPDDFNPFEGGGNGWGFGNGGGSEPETASNGVIPMGGGLDPVIPEPDEPQKPPKSGEPDFDPGWGTEPESDEPFDFAPSFNFPDF